MDTHHLIVHSLEHHPDADSAQLKTRTSPLPQDSISEALLEQLVAGYGRQAEKAYGRFGDNNSAFCRWLQSYLAGELSFTHLSQEVARALNSSFEQAGLSVSGFIVLAHYRHALSEYLMVTALPSMPNTAITDQLELFGTTQIDLGRLSAAAQINLTQLRAQSPDERYLSWLTPRSAKRTGDHLAAFLDCQPHSSSRTDTDTLLHAVSSYCDTVGRRGDTEIKRKVFEFCDQQLHSGEGVCVQALSKHISTENPELFSRCLPQSPSPCSPLQPSRNQLKKLVRYNGRDTDLAISFDSRAYGSRILYDEATDTLTIVGLPAPLKRQLAGEERHDVEPTSPA